MRRGLPGSWNRVFNAFRVFDRQLATAEGRGRYIDGIAAQIPEGLHRAAGGPGVKLEAIGRLTDLPGVCQEQLREAIEATAQNEKLTTILAVNYGGRAEIVDSVKRLIRDVQAGELKPEAIDPELFGRYLYTSKWPDPDLLIRTSGEMRVSNFLLWQVSYTEIFVTRKLWPDFKKQDLYDAVEEFSKRQRRYGAV